ncbi:galactosyltransferase-related protein [Mycolicibacterium pulveris]|uniref:galactosyltransferase-related protein n=1 Tax=Mycolicibacterium pulveris TaxID=36813 RepID=UPI003CEB83F2
MEFWRQTGWPIVTADSDTEIFSASQARNNAVRQAGAGTVVICDADTIPPMDNVLAAVADPVGVTYPHTAWRLIPADWVDKPISDFPNAPVVREHQHSFCGAVVTTTAEYWRLGGQPEEFVGWGYEDTAFHLRVLAISTFRRMPGIAYSLEHNPPDGSADTPGWSRDFSRNQELFQRHRRRGNQELLERYRNAEQRKWLMRELIKIHEDPQLEPHEP